MIDEGATALLTVATVNPVLISSVLVRYTAYLVGVSLLIYQYFQISGLLEQSAIVPPATPQSIDALTNVI